MEAEAGSDAPLSVEVVEGAMAEAPDAPPPELEEAEFAAVEFAPAEFAVGEPAEFEEPCAPLELAAADCTWPALGEGFSEPAGFPGTPDGVPLTGAPTIFGTTGFGAATPAISEPKPNFCNVGASSLPVASILFADWNFWTAAIVSGSHFPVGSPV